MTIETTPFDAAKYLATPEAQAVVIRDALATGDAGYIAHALAVVARARGDDEAPKAKLSPAEIRKRQKACDSARASVRLSGLDVGPGGEAAAARFVAGETDMAGYLRDVHAIAASVRMMRG